MRTIGPARVAVHGDTVIVTARRASTGRWDGIAGWSVGTPVHIERRGWEQYAFDTRERAKAGHRTREWTSVAQSELEVVREMVRCLRLIGAGGWPE